MINHDYVHHEGRAEMFVQAYFAILFWPSPLGEGREPEIGNLGRGTTSGSEIEAPTNSGAHAAYMSTGADIGRECCSTQQWEISSHA